MQSSRNQIVSFSVTIWENLSCLRCFYIILFHILHLKRFRIKFKDLLNGTGGILLRIQPSNWLIPIFFSILSNIFSSRNKLIFISRLHWMYLQLNYSKILNIFKMIQNMRHSCMGNKDFCVV